MPDYIPIRYVCLSDMHLGAQNSLLTALTPNNQSSDTSVASPVLIGLVECLKELVGKVNKGNDKPTLILAGDILELALTTDNITAMAFERFIELILPEDGERLFKNIVFIPGNHDHHLWETARETQYVEYLKKPGQGPGALLDIPWHATSMFNAKPIPSLFLDGIVRRYPHLKEEQIGTVYPNLALMNSDNRRCAIITHGHFAESLYLLMSTMRKLMFPQAAKPELTWDYEAENFAWIDFFWSTMGRSGAVGSDVEIVYDKLQDQSQVRLLISNLATGLANRPGRASWKNWLQQRLLKKVLNLILFAVANAERTATDDYLTADAQKGLQAYIEGPVLKQIAIERNGNVPPNVAVVFGHTHKPFQTQMAFEGFQPGVHVYNTGGWVIDSVERHPKVGGAVVLADDDLNLTSLRMYNEFEDPTAYSVRVETATTANDAVNPFHQQIESIVDSHSDPWNAFSDEVSREIPRRVANLQSKIAQW
jgi:UDP-2,3-diacylglucosamine pyrophosphatase LpxH